jgi:phosphopantothenoylcysteine decarboxylase/phosphopantothenate--cysteine ligase
MARAVDEHFAGATVVVAAAAVADYRPDSTASSKLKKGEGQLTLKLVRTRDILGGLGERKGGRVLVGFAAETESLLANAREKLERKGADFIVANDVKNREIGMEADDNAVTILARDVDPVEIPKASKVEVAEAILDHTLGAVAVEKLP